MRTLFQIYPLLCFAVSSFTANEARAAFPAQAFDPDGFALATPGVELEFPRDHGSHPAFKSEWWYVTGQLETPDGAHEYGFQITFFRSATRDATSAEADGDSPSPSQLYMAHAALFDKKTGQFHHEERLNSGDWNADAAVGSLDLYNGNWYLRMIDPDTEAMISRFSLSGVAQLNLSLKPEKPKTLFGDQGFSKKGAEPGAASYYVTFTRLDVAGEIEIDGEAVPITGQAWMDHEFSSSQLSEGQIGWNWTSLQFDDGSELMAYVMRREDGQVDPHSRLTFIDPTGATTELTGDAFAWTPLRYWRSEQSGARYPVEYQLSWKVGDTRRAITVKPFGDEQELLGQIGDFVYWEGAGQAFDESGKLVGVGYTELAGYDQSLQGRF